MKDETATILEYLPNGYPLEKKTMPLAQAIGENNFTLLELVPRRGIGLNSGESVYIGQGKRDKIYYILGRLPPEKLTESSKQQLEEFIKEVVEKKEQEFVDFFNKSEAINKRLRGFRLLAGIEMDIRSDGTMDLPDDVLKEMDILLPLYIQVSDRVKSR